MTKQDVINYVMNSPANTNKAVLSDMLDSLVDYDGILFTEDDTVFGSGLEIMVEKFNFNNIKQKVLNKEKTNILLQRNYTYGSTYTTAIDCISVAYNIDQDILTCLFLFSPSPQENYYNPYYIVIAINANNEITLLQNNQV